MAYTSNEVKNAWKQRNYKTYQVNLRLDSDRELIEYVKKKQRAGVSTTDIFRDALQTQIDKGE